MSTMMAKETIKPPLVVTMDSLDNQTEYMYNQSEIENIILKLNQDKVIMLLPVITYVLFSVLIGLIGNSLVCYIYSFRLLRSPSRIFILFLAVLDLISCVVGSGSELTDLFQPYTFTTAWSCKLLRFGLSFTIIAASFTLICVAFDRYYKVCRPLKAFPVRKVKKLCICVALLSVLLSSPALIIFGTKTVQTDHDGITGTECSTADGVKGTHLPIIYYFTLFTTFVILLGSFILLYVRIGQEIWKRKRLTIGETLPELVRDTKDRHGLKFARANSNPVDADDMSGPSYQTDDESRAYCDNPAVSETDNCESNVNGNKLNVADGVNTENNGNGQTTQQKRFPLIRRRSNMGRMSIRTMRTTSIFFVVSVAFVLSFLPYLIANILKFTKLVFYDIASSAEEIVYNFCVRSFFISNFINPIIYSALNRNFRKECRKLLRRIRKKMKDICCCCCARTDR